jgi:hypothetical protein
MAGPLQVIAVGVGHGADFEGRPRGATQRRRRRRIGRLVPATNQSRTLLRPVQSAHPG